MPSKPDSVTTVVLTPELRRRLAALAARQTVSVSAVVRQAVLAWLAAHSNGKEGTA